MYNPPKTTLILVMSFALHLRVCDMSVIIYLTATHSTPFSSKASWHPHLLTCDRLRWWWSPGKQIRVSSISKARKTNNMHISSWLRWQHQYRAVSNPKNSRLQLLHIWRGSLTENISMMKHACGSTFENPFSRVAFTMWSLTGSKWCQNVYKFVV